MRNTLFCKIGLVIFLGLGPIFMSAQETKGNKFSSIYEIGVGLYLKGHKNEPLPFDAYINFGYEIKLRPRLSCGALLFVQNKFQYVTLGPRLRLGYQLSDNTKLSGGIGYSFGVDDANNAWSLDLNIEDKNGLGFHIKYEDILGNDIDSARALNFGFHLTGKKAWITTGVLGVVTGIGAILVVNAIGRSR